MITDEIKQALAREFLIDELENNIDVIQRIRIKLEDLNREIRLNYYDEISGSLKDLDNVLDDLEVLYYKEIKKEIKELGGNV